ncbi:MAG: hypothetical protein AUH85_13090 [Chloroflexi bacterium 13_1_40CM_4_68_4]|nr:MAG: hypothetical protein AUH85_13090 [Chloroflexi bacterium 13_1_40CM_4_68_4]
MRALRALSTPEKIQRFLDEIPYNLEKNGETVRSPRRVLHDRTAHCFEGAIFAAAALRVRGERPLIVDLASVRDDDHVIAPYRVRGQWGAIATSKFAGIRFREPVYRTLRELVLSYFEDYYNDAGEKTLRGYSRPVDLSRFDRIGWMTTASELWPLTEYLYRVPHVALVPQGYARGRHWMDRRLYEAGYYGYPGTRHMRRGRTPLG